MENFDTKKFIESARAKGVPDQETFNYLNNKGLIPANLSTQQTEGTVNPMSENQNSTPFTYNPQTDTQGSVVGTGLQAGAKALGNVIPSAINMGIGVGKAAVNVFNPNLEKNTLANLGKIAVGGAEKLIPGEQGQEKNFDALVDVFKNRYGSLDSATKTAVEDPFGFGADVATLFTGGAAAFGKGALASNVISKVGAATKATQAVDYFANAMQKSSLNLTKTQKVNFANKLGDVSSFINKNKAVGTPEMKFNKMQSLITKKFEPTIQNTLNRNPIDISTEAVKNNLRSIKESIFEDSDFPLMEKRIDDFADSLDRFGKTIKGTTLNNLKRTTFKNAFNNAGDKVTDVLEFALGDKLYDTLSAALKEKGVTFNGVNLETFNAGYKNAIDAQKVLNLARKRPLAGFVSKLSAAGLGLYFGQMFGPVGAALGPFVAQPLAGLVGGATNIAKGIGAKAISTGAKNVPTIAPTIMSGSNTLEQ